MAVIGVCDRERGIIGRSSSIGRRGMCVRERVEVIQFPSMAQRAPSVHSLVAWSHGNSAAACVVVGQHVSKDTGYRIRTHTTLAQWLVWFPFRQTYALAHWLLRKAFQFIINMHACASIRLIAAIPFAKGLSGLGQRMALVGEFATLALSFGFQHDSASLINLQNMDKDSEGADGSGNSSERYYCPYPNCKRSFAELWRLKVHYRCGGARQHNKKGMVPGPCADACSRPWRGLANSYGLHRC